VPGYPKDTIEQKKKEIGYDDGLVTEAEHFYLWVVEGPERIRKELPIFDRGMNILLVNDLKPYKTRKVRILNGIHTSLVPLSYLLGFNTIGEVMQAKEMKKVFKEVIYEEILPTLNLPKEELISYVDAVFERFENPFLKHRLINICLNSMSKYNARVLPTVLDYYKINSVFPPRLVFGLAALIWFYKGDRNGEKIPLADNQDILDLYKRLWSNHDGTDDGIKKIVTEVLAYEKNWGRNLNEVKGLNDLVTLYLTKIEESGVQNAFKEIKNG